MHGDFDAGILKDTMAFKWEGKGLRILHASAHLPPYNVAVSSSVSPELRQKITDAFISLDGNNPEHLEVIKALDKKYNGFTKTSDREYDVVRDLIKPFN
jgi:phosphonate transport system substrate-binding protein